MKMKRSLILVLLSLAFLNQTQAQNPKWSLPNKYLATLTGTTTFLPTVATLPPETYQGNPSSVLHNLMVDQNGNLKFFIVDGAVYDDEGYLIDYLHTEGQEFPSQEYSILPHPCNPDQFYVFYGEGWDEGKPYYSIIDFTLTNVYHPVLGEGGLVEDLPANPGNFYFELPNVDADDFRSRFGFAITPRRTDDTHFLFMHDGNTLIERFIVSTSGVIYDGAIIIPALFGESSEQRAEMEIIPIKDGLGNWTGNYRLATSFTGNNGSPTSGGITIYQTDLYGTTGNVIPGTEYFYQLEGPPMTNSLTRPFVYGLEFSPSGRYLYVTHNTNTFETNPINYFDCVTHTKYTLPISLTEQLDFKYSQIERALPDALGDVKLYFATSDRLATLTNPDNPGVAIWDNNAITGITYPLSDMHPEPNRLKSYILPDQIDDQNYADLYINNSQECCIASLDYASNAEDDFNNPIFIASSGNWSPGAANNPFNSITGDVFIQHKLIIPENVSVTATGMNFYFAPGASLEIQNSIGSPAGGRLILKGCTLSVDGRCNQGPWMWDGVEIWGSGSSVPQTPYASSKHGKIELMNNGSIPCIIEHALKGITTSKISSITWNPSPFVLQYVFNLAPNTGGGIIRANNAIFRNNWFDVDMRDYVYGTTPNQSYFTNCQFTTDAPATNPQPLNGTITGYPKYPLFHVYLNNLLTINFKGCDWKNQYATDASSIITLGYGIRSIDAKFNVVNNCTSILFPCPPANIDHSNFEDLEFGIFTTNNNPLRTVTCTEANFTNNRKGILLRAVNYAIVNKNIFNIYKSVAPNSTAQVYGLYLHGCTGYQVQENLFQEITPTLPIGNSYGAIVVESGNLPNEIYKNTFQNLRIGGQSQGVNACVACASCSTTVQCPSLTFPGPGQDGLRWKCNVFNNEISFGDLVVTSGRIAYDQGFSLSSSLAPAGNLFNHNGMPPSWNIFANSTVQQFSYSYHDELTPPNYFEPVNYTGPPLYPTLPVHVDLNESTYCSAFGNTCCQSKIGVKSLQMLITEVGDYRNEIAEKLALIDGGSTTDLLAYINNPAISIGQKRDKLLSASPYLSDAVLISFLNLNPPVGIIQQVLLANSGVSEQVWLAVENMNLPNGINNTIEGAIDVFSARDQLFQQISSINSEKNYNLYEVVGYYLRDTISISPMDSILAILDPEEEKVFLITKGDVNIEKEELIEAVSIKNQLIADFGDDNNTKMLDLKIQLAVYPSKGYGILNNPVLYDKTLELAYDENDKINQLYAQALLSLAADSIFPEIIEDVMMAYSMPYNGNSLNDGNTSIIKIYPNPVLDELYIESITNVNGEAWSFVNLTVSDMQGRTLITKNNPDGWTFLNLALGSIQSGNYIIKLTDLTGNFEIKTFVKVQ